MLLLPFVAIFSLFHLFFYQSYLQWILVLGVGALVFGLARRLAFASLEDKALLWPSALPSVSVFIGVAIIPASRYFAQVVTTFGIVLELANSTGYTSDTLAVTGQHQRLGFIDQGHGRTDSRYFLPWSCGERHLR